MTATPLDVRALARLTGPVVTEVLGVAAGAGAMVGVAGFTKALVRVASGNAAWTRRPEGARASACDRAHLAFSARVPAWLLPPPHGGCPSAHAALATYIALHVAAWAAWVATRVLQPAGWPAAAWAAQVGAAVAAVAAVVAVGGSRVACRCHTPAQVLAGVALAIAFVALGG